MMAGNDSSINKPLAMRKIKGFHKKLDNQLEPKNDDSRKIKI